MSNLEHVVEHWRQGSRVDARGVVIRDDKVLLVKAQFESQPLFMYPGGGQKPGESLREAVEREVREETMAHVESGRLLAVLEHAPFKMPGGYTDVRRFYYGDVHRISFMFECTLESGSEPRLPDSPDGNQVGVEWVPLAELSSIPVAPDLAAYLPEALNNSHAIFFEVAD